MELTDLDFVASTGATVSLSHRSAMQSSLSLLAKKYKFGKMQFWGKLTGTLGDYLIAAGFSESHAPASKLFFFCQDGVSWAQLPRLSPEEKGACAALLPATLEGDIAHVHGGGVVEELLLAHVVSTVEVEAAIAPAGALALTEAGNIVPNPGYAGSAGSWVLLGQPKPTDPLKPLSAARVDFLQPASTLLPAGALFAVADPATGATTLRSAIWPGFVAFSKEKKWGYCYCGSGAKNVDVAFMLP